MAIQASNTKKIRVISGDLDITITGSSAKIQELTDLLTSIRTPAICTGLLSQLNNSLNNLPTSYQLFLTDN